MRCRDAASLDVPDTLLMCQYLSIVLDSFTCDHRQHRPPELLQDSGACHGSLDIVDPDAHRELDHQIDVLPVLTSPSSQNEIGKPDSLALGLRQAPVLNCVVEQVGQRTRLHDSQATCDRAEVRWSMSSVVLLKRLAVEMPEPIFCATLGGNELRKLLLGAGLGQSERLKGGLNTIETPLDPFEAGFDALKPRFNSLEAGFDPFQASLGTCLGFDKLPDERRKLDEIVGEHVPTQLSPPFRVLSQQLDQIVKVLDGEGHRPLPGSSISAG